MERAANQARRIFCHRCQTGLGGRPTLKQIHLFKAPEQMQLLMLDDELTGGNVLPGISTPVRAIFEE